MPPVSDATPLSTVVSQGESDARIKWYFRDDSSNEVIVPTGLTTGTKLFDPNDVQRGIPDASTVATVGVTPTQDTDNGFYVDVDFPTTAALGTWYLRITYTHEGVSRTKDATFTLVAAGASVTASSTRYCEASQVATFLSRNVQGFDANTLLAKTDVEDIIEQAMDFVDRYTQRSFKPNTVTNEYQDAVYADKWRWHGDYVVQFRTTHRPIRSVTTLEVVQGGTFVNITTPAENRTSTWYKDDLTGEFFIVGSNIPSILRKGIRISYTWGESTVPKTVRDATIRLTASYIMESEAYAVDTPETSILGSLDARIDRWQRWALATLDLERGVVVATQGG